MAGVYFMHSNYYVPTDIVLIRGQQMHRQCGRMALVKQNADIYTLYPGHAVAIANGTYRIESHYQVLRDDVHVPVDLNEYN